MDEAEQLVNKLRPIRVKSNWRLIDSLKKLTILHTVNEERQLARRRREKGTKDARTSASRRHVLVIIAQVDKCFPVFLVILHSGSRGFINMAPIKPDLHGSLVL